MNSLLIQPTRISEYFGLNKRQSQVDFVDVPTDEDLPLFLDPFAISLRPDRWSRACASDVQQFFQLVVDRIRSGDRNGAEDLLRHLGEPNETRLGLSKGRPKGAGIGRHQASQLYDALADSAAVKTGFLSHLEETELLIPGIGRDKVSDLTTNVIRKHLVEYTLEQCLLLGIPTSQSPLPAYFDSSKNRWASQYFELPRTSRGPLLLVPKAIVRYDLAYNHQSYYHGVVVEYLRAEELKSGSSLVHTLKDGRHRVFKKDVEAKYPLTKEYLYKFSKDRPQILQQYRDELTKIEKQTSTPVTDDDEANIAKMLAVALDAIPAGSSNAGAYHSLMIGVLEFLFFPQLLHPVKEKEIHDGRKRIDIHMENGARDGDAFSDLHTIKKLPCAYVAIECKNYTTEVANPELDQLSGRFSPNYGKLGLLCCRTFENRDRFVQRCRDTFRDDRGLILPLDDNTVRELLSLVAAGRREQIDGKLRTMIGEIWV